MEGHVRQDILKDIIKQKLSGSEVLNERTRSEMAQVAVILRKVIATTIANQGEKEIGEDLK